ncbi:MAG: PQQ-binding-like beta-propeller repeat protein [Armatimonadota bacterium]
MTPKLRRIGVASMVALGALSIAASAADWPQWGRDSSRNMVSDETGLPQQWDPGRFKGNTEEIDMATTKNVRWVAKLGSQSYGNPTVAGGKVFVGTNNEGLRNPKQTGDRSVVMCFDEKTGELLWQLAVPKLGTGKVSDWEYLGICSSPAVEGDRVYLVTNRCEAICLDVNGMANGNDGPYKTEGQYLAGPGNPAMEVGPKDADIIWVYDLREELGVFPHNTTSNSLLILEDRVVLATSNGVDWTHTNIPNPKAPALAVLNKQTGELMAEEADGISARTLHCNWSSPTLATVNGQRQIIYGGGDGFAYGYDVNPVKADDGLDILKQLWKVDLNPPHYRTKDGKPIKYALPDGPSEVISTPVFYKNKVFINIGQDPEHGEGVGNLVCIDPAKAASGSGVVWCYDKIARSISTPSIVNDLVISADYSGFVHCLDANTGKPYWVFDTKSHIWGSTLAADGKVYFGTEDGDIIMLAADKTMKELGRIDMRAPVYSSPIVANGTLYVATQTHLYAIGK